jgi:hypothetical protein
MASSRFIEDQADSFRQPAPTRLFDGELLFTAARQGIELGFPARFGFAPF